MSGRFFEGISRRLEIFQSFYRTKMYCNARVGCFENACFLDTKRLYFMSKALIALHNLQKLLFLLQDLNVTGSTWTSDPMLMLQQQQQQQPMLPPTIL